MPRCLQNCAKTVRLCGSSVKEDADGSVLDWGLVLRVHDERLKRTPMAHNEEEFVGA